MTFLLSGVFLFSAGFLSPQSLGGVLETIYRWEGGRVGQWHGDSVAGAGDVNADGFDDVVIGVPHASPFGVPSEGVVLVKSGLDGSQIHRLTGVQTSNLGSAVDGAGDVNADGFDDIVAGAVGENEVYLFSGKDGSILHIFPNIGGFSSGMGLAVAGIGDIDHDGHDDIAFSAPYEPIGQKQRVGTVRLVSGRTYATLHSIDGSKDGQLFGHTLAGGADFDQDGYLDLVIAGPGEGFILYNTKISVHSGRTGSLIQLLSPPANSDMSFGWSLDTGCDYTGDGIPDVVVGAPRWSVNYFSGGAVFIYSGATGGLVKHVEGAYFDTRLGEGVACLPDMDGDGLPDIAASAQRTKAQQTYGAVRIYSSKSLADVREVQGAHDASEFGTALACAGDTDGDGLSDLIVGARNEEKSSNSVHAGASHVIQWRPAIQASTTSLSAITGGFVDFQVDFTEEDAGWDYAILMSAAGQGPVFSNDVAVPLTPDHLFFRCIAGTYASGFSSPTGALDVFGDASASFTAAPGDLAAWIDRTLWIAAVSLNATTRRVRNSSIALPITVRP